MIVTCVVDERVWRFVKDGESVPLESFEKNATG
jgi:hypothetical protein